MPDATMGPRCVADVYLGVPKQHQGSWGLLCSAFWQGLVCTPRGGYPQAGALLCVLLGPSSTYQTALALLLLRVQYNPANTCGGSLGPLFAHPSPSSWPSREAAQAEGGEDALWELLPGKLVSCWHGDTVIPAALEKEKVPREVLVVFFPLVPT